jgi:RHS repeat-associated protein
LSDGTYNYTYDANGNMLTRTQISNASSNDHQTIYTRDYRNRLASVTNKDNAGDVTQTVTYQYDLFNRRIGETVVAGETTSETRFVYDGNQMILQFDKTGTGNLAASDLSRRYLWGPAVDQALAAEDASDNVTWLLADNQGTVRDVVTFASGQTTVADRIYYGVFGAIASQTSASANPGIGYTGQFWDAASCMYYCIARWYDPSTGRYVSADPTGFRAGDANLFRYVFNNPTNWVDPTGEVVGSAVPMLALGVADLGPHAVDKKDLGPRGKGLLEAMPDIRGFLKGQAKQTPGNKELSGVIVKKQDGKCVCVPQNRTDKSGMARPYGRYGWKSNNPVGTIIGTYHTHFPGAAGEPNPSDQDANDSQAKGTPDIGIHYTPDPANPAGGSIYDSWITDEKAGEYQLPREVE